jgi:hypothetical protein
VSKSLYSCLYLRIADKDLTTYRVLLLSLPHILNTGFSNLSTKRIKTSICHSHMTRASLLWESKKYLKRKELLCFCLPRGPKVSALVWQPDKPKAMHKSSSSSHSDSQYSSLWAFREKEALSREVKRPSYSSYRSKHGLDEHLNVAFSNMPLRTLRAIFSCCHN